MAYFSNGEEGQLYREGFCQVCVHDKNRSCPIWNLHVLFNYAECNNKDSFLHQLIPRSEGGLSNEECRLFIHE